MKDALYILAIIVVALLYYAVEGQAHIATPISASPVSQVVAPLASSTAPVASAPVVLAETPMPPATTPKTPVPVLAKVPPPPAAKVAEPVVVKSPAPVAAPAPLVSTGGLPTIGGCQIFPSSNAWNEDVSKLLVSANSAAYISSIGLTGHLHADFGGGGAYGIPFVVVPKTQVNVPITFTAYGDESDPGPYPVPFNAPVEGGAASDGDRHVLVLQQGICKLFELYRSFQVGAGWNADSGAVYDLASNALRPDHWTSADAAGLPILPGLVRYDEVAAGAVNHALRFTVQKTQRGFIHPATHFASSSTNPNLPPMGLRLRLKADYDISHFTGESRVILEGLKKYGMILADNGSNWYITGGSDSRWNDDDLNQLKTVPGSAFEAVDTGPILK